MLISLWLKQHSYLCPQEIAGPHCLRQMRPLGSNVPDSLPVDHICLVAESTSQSTGDTPCVLCFLILGGVNPWVVFLLPGSLHLVMSGLFANQSNHSHDTADHCHIDHVRSGPRGADIKGERPCAGLAPRFCFLLVLLLTASN